MNRTTAILGACLVVAAAVASYFWTANAPVSDSGAMPDDVDLVAGQIGYRHFSGRNQVNWRSPGDDGRLPAPPHDETGHTWHHADQVLFEYTKLGGRALMAAQGMEFDSGMPGFGEQLSDKEIWNILGYIKSTWPERIREMQAERTEG